MMKRIMFAARLVLITAMAAVLLAAGFPELLNPGRPADSESFPAHTVSAEAFKPVSEAVSESEAMPASPVFLSPKKSSSKAPVKTVYLTFDDGPSGLTGEVLDILKKEGIKATFFVLGQQADSRPELIARMHEEGHAIGNHSYNHDYVKLYQRFTEFWRQIKQTEETVHLITGERPQLVRAPGGTAGKFDAVYFRLLKQGGYKVFDWNVDSGDSRRKGVPAAEIVKGAITPVAGDPIVLLHDGSGHQETVKALPEIIRHYKKNGYRFKPLTPETAPVQFKLQKIVKPKLAQPNARWIEEHVAVNAALFKQGRTVSVEMGGLAAEFAPGEYRMENGRILVPLRSTVERLGGNISWDKKEKTVRVTLAKRTWKVKPVEVRDAESANGQGAAAEAVLIGNSVWMPLRDVLQMSGRPVKEIAFESGNCQIVTL